MQGYFSFPHGFDDPSWDRFHPRIMRGAATVSPDTSLTFRVCRRLTQAYAFTHDAPALGGTKDVTIPFAAHR